MNRDQRFIPVEQVTQAPAIHIRPATVADVDAIAALVHSQARRGNLLPRPASAIYDSIDDWIVAAVPAPGHSPEKPAPRWSPDHRAPRWSPDHRAPGHSPEKEAPRWSPDHRAPDHPAHPAHPADEILGCVSLLAYRSGLVEVRSLAVQPAAQGLGVGTHLMQALLAEAARREIPRLFALTRAVSFFLRFGFTITRKEQFPEKVWHDCWQCPLLDACDETAVVLEVGSKE